MGAVAVDLACLAVDAEGSVVQSGALLLALGTYVRPALWSFSQTGSNN